MLEQLDAEQNAQRANATYAAMESHMPKMSCIAPEDIYEYAEQPPVAYKHIRYDNLADSVPGISVVKTLIKV